LILQVRKILAVMGTPRDRNYGFELHPEAQRFLEREPQYPGRPFRSVIPHAPDEAVDLLQGEPGSDERATASVSETSSRS
jgi:hypothetical protein